MTNYTEMTQNEIDTVVENEILPFILVEKTKEPRLYEGNHWFHVKIETEDAWTVGLSLTQQLSGTGMHGRMIWNNATWELKSASIDSDQLFTLSFKKAIVVKKSQFRGMTSQSDFS